jgi:hypothetical protein
MGLRRNEEQAEMKKILIATVIISAATAGVAEAAVRAMWTGRHEMVQTVTYRMAWNCQYMANGQTFWMVFDKFCPSSVDVY